MKILNPFKLQNWEYKKFLMVILGIQLSLLGLFGINKLGVETPILRAFIGFIYLSFVPGYLILRILKLNKLNNLESLVSSLLVSLFIAMVFGAVFNIACLHLNIFNPISELIIGPFFVFNFFLTLISYVPKNQSGNENEYLEITFWDILLTLIPVFSIFGIYLINIYSNTLLTILCLLIISIIVLSTLLQKNNNYPYKLWIISVSPLLIYSLFTNYIYIQDVWIEYVVAKNVIAAGFWDLTLYENHNSVLSTAILPAMLNIFCDINLNWIYKIIFPLYLSVLPLEIYQLYRNYFSKKEAFISCFLIISLYPYYNTILFLTKQIMAEIYLVGMLIILFSKNSHLKILFPIFGAGIVLSHYGTAYIIAGSLIFSALILRYGNSNYKKFNFLYRGTILYLIICIVWNIHISSSSTFEGIVHHLYSMLYTIKHITLSADSSRGINTLVRPLPLGGTFLKYSMALISLCIGIGFLKEVFEKLKNKSHLSNLFLINSLYWIIILFATVFLPYFAVMSPNRLYHLSSIILAPLCTLGLILIFKKIPNLSNKKFKPITSVGIIYIIIFLMHTQVAFEIFNVGPLPSPVSTISENDIYYSGLYCSKYMFDYDVYGALWLSNTSDPDLNIYANNGRGVETAPLKTYGNVKNNIIYIKDDIPSNNYIYLHYANICKQVIYSANVAVGTIQYERFNRSAYSKYNTIYSNGGSTILFS